MLSDDALQTRVAALELTIADYRNSKVPRYVGADGKWVAQPHRVARPFTNLADASRIENLTKPPE